MKNIIKTFKIVVEYDGSYYHGWQCQKETKTIQEQIEKALKYMTKQEIRIAGSGRTDAGVHAIGQVASYRIQTNLSSMTFYKGLNSILPNDIIIKSCETVSNKFHARFDAKLKTYRYYILNSYLGTAIGQKFFWHIRKKLNIQELKEAASLFIGKKDFKSFEGAGSPRVHTIRKVTKSFIKFHRGGIITYTVEANGFLRFMVRNIVGTLVSIGLGRIKVGQLHKLIDSRDRTKVGPTAPPQGLFLIRVDY